MSKNVILGLYDGYSSLDTIKGGLRLFIESLRFYNTDDKVVIFVQTKNVFPELKTFAEKFNVELANFNEKDVLEFNEDRQTYRLLLYKNWLSNNAQFFDKIMLSDTNDVMFFGNPFLIETKSIYCALEKSRYKNHGENRSSVICNLGWLWYIGWQVNYENLSETCLNKSPIEKIIFNKNVVCSGTIIGKSDAVVKYLEEVTKNKLITYTGLDQGCWNKYVQSQPPETLDMVRVEHSKILTLDSIDHLKIPKDEKGFYMNEVGERYLIVHQIDRGGNIGHFKQLHRKYHT